MLADHLGLSPASISLVLNHAPAAEAIPKPTQERIRAAATRFDYRPNTLAKSLRRQRSFTIGVMVPEISDGYASMVMSGIEDHAAAGRLSLLRGEPPPQARPDRRISEAACWLAPSTA